MNKQIQMTLLVLCALTIATPSYAGWLDKLDTGKKLAIGTAAIGIIHSAATADDRKAEEEKQQADVKRKEDEREAKKVQAAKLNKQKTSRVDRLITGKFGYTLGAKFNESNCLSKDRDIGLCYVSSGSNKFFSEAMVIYNPITMETASIIGIKKEKLKYKNRSNLKHSQNIKQANKEYAATCAKQYNFVVDALMQKGFKETDLKQFPILDAVQSQGGDFIVGSSRKQSFICAVEATDVGKITFGKGWKTSITYMLTYTDTKIAMQAEDATIKLRKKKRDAKAKAAASDF
jgi:hypothetical protein